MRLINRAKPHRFHVRARRALRINLRAARGAEGEGQRVAARRRPVCRGEFARDIHILAHENGVVRRAARRDLLALATPALPHADGLARDGESDFVARAASSVGLGHGGVRFQV